MLVASAPAVAQSDFFRVAPGPLSSAHAAWDNGDGCGKCHALGQGVTNLLCLDCHAHASLKRAIASGEGLHAHFKEPCIRCHPEHKGRSAALDKWELIGGRATFDHARTDFPLTGKHLKVPCTACHRRTLKSGRTSFVGLSRDCNSCHKNPHGFTTPELRAHKCEQCHKGAVTEKLRGVEVPFDHLKLTGLPLTGKHARALCTDCHKNAKMTSDGTPRTCRECHRSPHGPTFAPDKPCARCHAPDRAWKRASFDHDTTEFPLRNEHAKLQCDKCHRSPKVKPAKACATCHNDPHKGRWSGRVCEDCHRSGDARTMVFDHDRLTKFPLAGKHRTVRCRACHRGAKPTEFEKHATPACQSCHQHQNAHRGELRDKPCAACHGKGGSIKDLLFDHQKDTRFKLTGLHARLLEPPQCRKCHPDKRFRTNKLRCVECHKDTKHKGQLGDDCGRCHTGAVEFAKIQFEHNAQSRFKLEGKHVKVACEKCHPPRERLYRRPDIRCVACHAKTEPHQRKLGDDCGRCHLPAPGAPKFDHDTMTKFPRRGKHRDVACAFCHRTREPGAGPPAVGWTRTLAPPGKLDRLFPVMGRRCAECHADKHEGRYGAVCDSCHQATSFKDVSRAVHDTGAFRLAGAHDRIACQRCHEANRLLAGTGDLCVRCHLDDDRHLGALGPLCGDCHNQHEWLPSTFSHALTGFTLNGAHRFATCRSCHGLGSYAGLPAACSACHLADALRVTDPVHSAELERCEECHSEVGFVPSRFRHATLRLRGAHLTLRCRDCHAGGTYAGTPGDCSGCHMGAYLDPATTPNHTLAGYSLACDDCHTQVAWSPARTP